MTAPAAWTAEEKAILAEHWKPGSKVRDFMPLLPGRTYKAIKAYGARNGYEKRGNDEWTPEEMQILRDNWKPGCKIEDLIALLPGRTKSAIETKASRRMALPSRKPQGQTAWDAIRQVLSDGHYKTANQLVEETGWSERMVRRAIREYIGRGVYVVAWMARRKTGRPPKAMFALGNLPNVRKPRPLTDAQKQRRYVKRLKDERPDVQAAREAKAKVRRVEREGKLIRPDFAAAWLFHQEVA